MLLTIREFGGIAPRVKDPSSLPDNHGQVARNCRFDEGGVGPLDTDLEVMATTKTDVFSLFVYKNAGEKHFFQWTTDVDAVKTPLANDSWNRVFFTENGHLRVTDNVMFNSSGTSADYPAASLNPSPPAPAAAPTIATDSSGDAITGLEIVNSVYASGVDAIESLTVVTVVDYEITSGKPYIPMEGIGVTGTVGVIEWSADPDAPYYGLDPQRFVGELPLVFYGGGGEGATGHATYKYFTGNPGGDPPDPAYAYLDSVTLDFGGSNYSTPPLVREHFGVVDVIANLEGTIVSGTFDLIFTGGGGTGAAGTYTVVNNVITAVNLTNGGSGYTSLPTVTTQSGVGLIVATAGAEGLRDMTLQESRVYCYTYVNQYGSEGPPSAVSTIKAIFDGDLMSITDLLNFTDADYAITHLRLYRANQTATGTAIFQLVVELPIGTTSYDDTAMDSSLSEILASLEWDGAPAGMKGLIDLPNGVLAGFVDNAVCFSYPYYPHAWPVSYQKKTSLPVVGISSFGTSVVVLTEGQPYVIVGNDPASMVMEEIDGFSCMAKRGMVKGDQITFFPSPQGINAIGPSAGGLVTDKYMTQDDWKRLYDATTLTSFYWQGKYIGFYTKGAISAGFMLDAKAQNLIDLDFYATAGFYDHSDGTLYLVIDNHIYRFCEGTGKRLFDYTSKRYRYAPNSLKCGKVIAKEYPVTIEVVFPEIPQAIEVTTWSSAPFRLQQCGITLSCEVRVLDGNKSITLIHLANTMEELPQ